MNKLLQQWVDLWQSGIGHVWQDYTNAQTEILNQGRALVGQTPAEVIYQEGRLRLMHYKPQIPDPKQTPVLCVPSLINHYYIMDLTSERSLVRYLLGCGIDVYMLDWGKATLVDRFRPFDEYITGLLRRCVQHIRYTTGQETITLLGYCMGGLMSAAYTVLYPQEVRNLINLAGPINYHDDGIYSVWTRPDWFDVDLLVDALGNIPAELLNITFKLVHPTNELIQALNYWERHNDPTFMSGFAAMQLWTNDPTPFPGEAFRKYIKDLYQANLLLNGAFTIGGKPINLSQITAPTITIAARRDHIAPWESVAVLHDLISSPDKDLIVLESGHIGMVIGSSARQNLWPHLGEWLVARSS